MWAPAALAQPIELLMIGGGAAGAFVVANSGKELKATLAALPGLFKGSRFTKDLYMELMSLLYELLMKVRKEGFLSIEKDIDHPPFREESIGASEASRQRGARRSKRKGPGG